MKEGVYKIKELFDRDCIFSIPEYQRNYAWEEDEKKGNRQLSDFYNDLRYLSGDRYFMGTLILRETDKKKVDNSRISEYEIYEVIDGQQRLTTIVIFIKSAIDILEEKNGGSIDGYIKKLKRIYIEDDNIQKLKLLGADETFFRNQIIGNQKYPDEIMTPSQRRLKKAKEYFDKEIQKLEIDEIKELISKLSKARLLVYPVREIGDAMLMFETVNDRGKPLSNLEKTKSFLMYIAYISSEQNEINSNMLIKLINEKFGNIYRYMEDINESKYISGVSEDDIQRYHWALWYKDGYKESFQYIDKLKEYFRELMMDDKNNLLSKVEDYVISLEQVFYAFKEVFIDKINDFETLKNIVLLGRVANFYPLIIASWIRTKDKTDNFKLILSVIEKFIFRVYLIGRRRSDIGVGYFYSYAHKLFNNYANIGDINNYANIGDIIEEIIKDATIYYASNERLKNELNNLKYSSSNQRISTHQSKDIRYIFYHYELMLREKEGENLSISLEEILSEKYTIEHILAENLDKEKRPEDLKDDGEFYEYVYRLGNLVLCSRRWNSSMGNKPFEEKKKCNKGKHSCYQKSIFKCQQKLAEYGSFSKKEIERRQKELINLILTK